MPTKADIFAPLPDDVSIPIDKSKYAFQFSRYWFRNRNQATWSTKLKPRFNRNAPVRMIQIGVFEGMDLVWCFQNILTHPESFAIAIDPWEATTKLSGEEMEEVHQRALHNLEPWIGKVQIVQGRSQEELPKRTALRGSQDLIIIDGDHTAPAVLTDAVHSFDLLRKGGWMVFDDVRNRITKEDHVQAGIEMFLKVYGSKVKLVWQHRFSDCYEKITK